MEKGGIPPSPSPSLSPKFCIKFDNLLHALTSHIFSLEQDVIKTYQAGIEKTILKYINCAIPRPSRPVRHLFGRIGNLLYSRGDERSLFDTLAATQNLLGLKKVDDPLNRM